MLPKPETIKSVALLAGIGGALYLGFKLKQGAEQATKQAEIIVTEKINPASNKNIIFQNFTPESVKFGSLDPVFKFLGL